jgi:hypothetical protein
MINLKSKPFKTKISKIFEYSISRFGSAQLIELNMEKDIKILVPHYKSKNPKGKLDVFLYNNLFFRSEIHSYLVGERSYYYQFQWNNLLYLLQEAELIKGEYSTTTLIQNNLITTKKEIELNKSAHAFLCAYEFKQKYPDYYNNKIIKLSENCPRYIQITDQLPKSTMKYLFPNEYEYDINAAAYALTFQHAVIYAGCDDEFKYIPLTYLQKDELRQALSDELQVPIKIVKVILAAILYRRNIPQIKHSKNLQKELSKNNFHYFNYSLLQANMNSSMILHNLCNELKLMWNYLEINWEVLNDQVAKERFRKWYEKEEMNYDIDEMDFQENTKKVSRYSSCAFRSYIYFELERKVIDICINWLEENNYKTYVTKHDSFFCPYDLSNEEIDNLETRIHNETNYWISFKKEKFL